MESLLRAALVEWLRQNPALSERFNTIEEESPLATSPPWLGIAASAATDWSMKQQTGREVRIALEAISRGDMADAPSPLVSAITEAIEAMPREQEGFVLISKQFLRSRTERRARNLRAYLVEYRFRILAAPAPPS